MASQDRVLVTGISGFLGGHVALALLQQGYAVRGSLRDPAREDQVRAALSAAGADIGQLDFCALDLLEDRGWVEAAAGCRYLQHVASPFVLTMPEDEDAVIGPAIQGTIRAIRASLAAGHDRIVLTSSVAALDGGHRQYDRTLTTSDWTDVRGTRVNAYSRAKTLAEKVAWELVENEGASDRLSVINPGTMLGPLLDDDPGTSVGVIQRLLKGDMPMIPNLILPYVDVRDVADASVAAMTASEAADHRHILTNESWPLSKVAQTLRASLADGGSNIPTRRLPSWIAPVVALFDKSLRDSSTYLDVRRRYDTSSGIRLLGHPLRTTEEALLASARSVLDRRLV